MPEQADDQKTHEARSGDTGLVCTLAGGFILLFGLLGIMLASLRGDEYQFVFAYDLSQVQPSADLWYPQQPDLTFRTIWMTAGATLTALGVLIRKRSYPLVILLTAAIGIAGAGYFPTWMNNARPKVARVSFTLPTHLTDVQRTDVLKFIQKDACSICDGTILFSIGSENFILRFKAHRSPQECKRMGEQLHARIAELAGAHAKDWGLLEGKIVVERIRFERLER